MPSFQNSGKLNNKGVLKKKRVFPRDFTDFFPI